VAQCLAFSVPHAKLGEEVGVAVVLRPGQAAKDTELRAFCAERLAHFKVPRRIVILDEIPTGPTGKVQRIGLAEKLGLTG
jgi:acyl-CoA synthetase (AMP-forming)/AMP-acid ligase II